MGTRDRTALLGFGAFWLVIAAGMWLGVGVVQRLGMAGHATLAGRALAATVRPTAPTSPRGLTLESIFGSPAISLRGYARTSLRTLIATGDVIPARSVNYQMVIRNDFLFPFRPTAAYLRSGDVTLINLESPLMTAGCPVTVSGMQFCGDPRVTQGLNYAGVDIACSANNHIGNYGLPGIEETWIHLRDAGIDHCGLGQVVYRVVRGLRFAFLAYNCVGERFNYAVARTEIRAARHRAAVVVVSVHWGREYVPLPTTAPGIADDDPRRVGHWLVDSGADLVIGNHPHHVQGVEIYRGRLITYAHGNFVFDQMFTPADCPGDVIVLCSTREGVVGTYTFAGRRLVAVRYRPVEIFNYAQPRWADPAIGRGILRAMKAASEQLARTPHA